MYVDVWHFAGKRESKSLSIKNAGLWKIIQNIANKAYKLDIPQHMKDAGLTAIFHPWKLHLAPNDIFPGQILKPGPPILIESGDGEVHNEWKVLEVVDSRQTKKYSIQYKATYMGNWDD